MDVLLLYYGYLITLLWILGYFTMSHLATLLWLLDYFTIAIRLLYYGYLDTLL